MEEVNWVGEAEMDEDLRKVRRMGEGATIAGRIVAAALQVPMDLVREIIEDGRIIGPDNVHRLAETDGATRSAQALARWEAFVRFREELEGIG
jgi:hypothetical protein